MADDDGAVARGPVEPVDVPDTPDAPLGPSDFTRDLLRWSETLAAVARTGLGFTQSLYERERFEEVLKLSLIHI